MMLYESILNSIYIKIIFKIKGVGEGPVCLF